MGATRTTVQRDCIDRQELDHEPKYTFLFTDLHSSTELYERFGDVAAYEIVRRHFVFLANIVGDHGGVVVKTIGDAVMAAFESPIDAVKAALAMQARIADFNRTHQLARADRHLAMKVGVHCGGSIKVRSRSRFDYFGSAVNMAARLQAQSQGGDIVLSRIVAERPDVRPLLMGSPLREESLHLRGFDGPVDVVRVAAFQSKETA